MSGGSFFYAYRNVEDFCERFDQFVVEQRLMSESTPTLLKVTLAQIERTFNYPTKDFIEFIRKLNAFHQERKSATKLVEDIQQWSKEEVIDVPAWLAKEFEIVNTNLDSNRKFTEEQFALLQETREFIATAGKMMHLIEWGVSDDMDFNEVLPTIQKLRERILSTNSESKTT